MLSWDVLIDLAALESLLPRKYAYFARPVRDGLVVFLQGLPQSHQAEILTQQAALPPSTSVAARLGLLARGCPVLQKLGQVLARDQRLAPELRHHLCQLESLEPTVPLEMIQDTLRRELGDLDRLGLELAPAAIAEASVAVVIPFRIRDAHPAGQPSHGVFKLLKPGIQERLDQELALLEHVGSFLDERCDELGIPHLDYQEAFGQAREKLQFEVRLDLEQRHLDQARAEFADEPGVQIPELFDYCTPRVTAMQRVTGGKVTDHRLDSFSDRRQLARLVARAIIARPVFSTDGAARFHGDPHAGNLFFTTDHRLAILDWCLVGSLSERERVAIAQIVLGAMMLCTEQITSVLTELAERKIDAQALERVVNDALRRIRRGRLPGLAWLVEMLDDAVQTAGLRVAPDLMLFRKTLHTLQGVIAEIGGDAALIDEVMMTEFLRHFAAQWPRRWLASPLSRQFPTRLSNLDLARTMWSTPWTVLRYWTGQQQDLLAACRAACGMTHRTSLKESGATAGLSSSASIPTENTAGQASSGTHSCDE